MIGGRAEEGVALMTRIEIEDRTAEMLQEQARARRLSIDEYLRTLANEAASTLPSAELTMEEFDQALDELAAGTEHLPPLPADFSRADIYLDHD